MISDRPLEGDQVIIPSDPIGWTYFLISSLIFLGLSLGAAFYFRPHPFWVGTILLILAFLICVTIFLIGQWLDGGDPEGMMIGGLVFLCQVPMTLFGLVGLFSLFRGLYGLIRGIR